jgi:hypothetical protein
LLRAKKRRKVLAAVAPARAVQRTAPRAIEPDMGRLEAESAGGTTSISQILAFERSVDPDL